MLQTPTHIREFLSCYYGIAVSSVKEKLAYRFDFLSALVFTIMTIGLLYFLWTAIYQNSIGMEISLRDLITYVCLGQAIGLSRLSWAQRRVVYSIRTKIRSGDIVLDLIRPMDYHAFRLSDAFGLFLAESILINIPAFFFSLLFFEIKLPASPEVAIGFIVSLGGAFLIAFSLNFLISITAFWTYSTLGLLYANKALMDILAGSIIPLTLLPDWLKRLALILPFQGMAFTPISIYIGDLSGNELWMSIVTQYSWAVGMIVFTRLIWLRASKKIVIQGG